MIAYHGSIVKDLKVLKPFANPISSLIYMERSKERK